MKLRALLTAAFGVTVTIAIALGLMTPLPTAAVWKDNVWATAKVTTKQSSSTTYPGGLVPGPNTQFTTAPVWTLNQVSQACVEITVTTNSILPVPWSVRLDTSAQPWNGATTGYQLTYGFVISAGVVDGRYKTISGDPNSSPPRVTVASGSTYTFTVCNYSAGLPPVGESSWLTVTISDPVKTAESQVCRTITAIALGKTPFWFRWRATVPTASMFTALGAKGTYWWSYSNYSVVRTPDPSTNPATPSTVVVSSAINDTTSLLKDELRYDYTMCLNGST